MVQCDIISITAISLGYILSQISFGHSYTHSMSACIHTTTSVFSKGKAGMYLSGYTYNEESHKDVLSCVRRCLLHKKCLSVNYEEQTGICQYNTACHLTQPSSLVSASTSDVTYYYVLTWSEQIQLGRCSDESCVTGDDICEAAVESRYQCVPTNQSASTPCVWTDGCVNCLPDRFETEYNGQAVVHVPVGCFTTKPMPKYLMDHRLDIDWMDMVKTINQCARDAFEANNTYFAVEYYGECWINSGTTSFNMAGHNLLPAIKCDDNKATRYGTGGFNTQCVYKII